MALPRRKETGEPEPDLQGMEKQGKLDRQVSSGWRGGWWWVWIIVIVLIWYVGFGWGGSGGWFRHRAQPVTNDAQLSGAGAVMLQSSNKLQYAGQAFQVRNVPVSRQASPRAYWIGSAVNGTPMLLILQGAADYKSGMLIDADGQVLRAPPAAQAQQQWDLSSRDAQQMEQEGVYIQATEAQPVLGAGGTAGLTAPGPNGTAAPNGSDVAPPAGNAGNTAGNGGTH